VRRAIIGLAVLVALGTATYWGIRRVGPGEAAWNRHTGELLVAETGPSFVPAWRWRPESSPRVAGEVASVARGGVRVTVAVSVSFPSGRHALAPGADAASGLTTAVADVVRGQVETLSPRCLAGIGLADCPEAPEGALGGTLAERLHVAPEMVSAQIRLDPVELAAVRISALKELVGKPPRRVLFVGWDGADWEILEPLVGKRMMPNLARLMAEGSWGGLASFTPLLSPLIWTSMVTGVAPDEHGILDFVEVDPGSGAKVPITGRQRRVPALWNMASAVGLSVIVSGWWASWPAEPVNGVLISDRLFFLLSDAVAEGPPGTVVFPPAREPEFRTLAERAERETDEKVVRALLPVSTQAYRNAIEARRGMQDPIDGFRRIMVGTRTYFGAALQAAESTTPPADLTMVYAIGTDEIGHLLAPYLPPPLAGADPGFSQTAQIGVERYFSIVDRWLGRLLETCPERECAVVVVSDHGFKWGADRPREFSGTAAATAALWHRPTGIFVLAGKGIARLGRVVDAASVYDVAPTVAALLGLPPGTGWRGKPLPGCPVAALQPVDWRLAVPPESYRPVAPVAPPSPEYVKQLKALGYMETGEGTGQGEQATEGELNNLGLIHLQAKRYVEAEKAFKSAIERNPSYASPHYNLRRLYFETGRYDEADAELWRAVELKLRDSAGAVDRAAGDYEAHAAPDRAAALLAEARRRFPGDARLTVHRLAVLVGNARCSEATAEGREAADRFPSDARVQAFFGLSAACAGDSATAKRALQRSLELDPNQPEIRQALEALTNGN
jgi:predicted AlkP superfamily phosphohydrolase/phosphomutase/Flp pilus assembly protein TadD